MDCWRKWAELAENNRNTENGLLDSCQGWRKRVAKRPSISTYDTDHRDLGDRQFPNFEIEFVDVGVATEDWKKRSYLQVYSILEIYECKISDQTKEAVSTNSNLFAQRFMPQVPSTRLGPISKQDWSAGVHQECSCVHLCRPMHCQPSLLCVWNSREILPTFFGNCSEVMEGGVRSEDIRFGHFKVLGDNQPITFPVSSTIHIFMHLNARIQATWFQNFHQFLFLDQQYRMSINNWHKLFQKYSFTKSTLLFMRSIAEQRLCCYSGPFH